MMNDGVLNNAGYTIKDRVYTNKETGVAIAFNPDNKEWVTWEFKVFNGKYDYFFGHYADREDFAYFDFYQRIVNLLESRTAYYKDAIEDCPF